MGNRMMFMPHQPQQASSRRTFCLLNYLVRPRCHHRANGLSFHEDKQSSALQTKILRDVDAIDGLCRYLMLNGLNGLLVILYVTVIALVRQPILALYFLVTVPAGIALLKLFDRRFKEQYKALRIETEQMNTRVGEMLQMLPVTRAHGLEEQETRSVRSVFQRLSERGLQVDTLTELFASSSWFTFIVFQLACLVFSAWLVVHHKITVGDAVMYQTYFGMLIGAVQQTLGVFPALAQGREAIRSIGEILEAPEVEDYSGKRPAPVPTSGEIVFENVSFQYPRGREIALKDVSLRIIPGETIAFVGESGAGKSIHWLHLARLINYQQIKFNSSGFKKLSDGKRAHHEDGLDGLNYRPGIFQ